MLSQPSLLATGSFNDQPYLCTYEDHPLTSFSHLQPALTYFAFRLLRIYNSPCLLPGLEMWPCDPYMTAIITFDGTRVKLLGWLWVLLITHISALLDTLQMVFASKYMGICCCIFSLNSVLWNVDFPFFWHVQCVTVQAVAAWHICLLDYPTPAKGARHKSVNCWVPRSTDTDFNVWCWVWLTNLIAAVFFYNTSWDLYM